MEQNFLNMPRSPEHNSIPTEAKEGREPKVEFDWDKHMRVKYGEHGDLHQPEQNDITSLQISGPKGETDLLELTGQNDVFLVVLNNEERPGGGYKYRRFVEKIELNKFESLSDLVVLFHELGHAAQSRDEKFKKIDKMANGARKFITRYIRGGKLITSVESYSDVKRLADKVREIINEEKLLLDEEQLKKFNRVESEKQKAIKEWANTPSSGASREKYNARKKYKAFRNKQQEIVETMGLLEIAALPIKIQERDATARALKWFREISDKTGIDFFKKFKIEKKSSIKAKYSKYMADPRGECGLSMEKGMSKPDDYLVETSILEEMKSALFSYGAKTLTDTYDPGRIGKRIKISR